MRVPEVERSVKWVNAANADGNPSNEVELTEDVGGVTIHKTVTGNAASTEDSFNFMIRVFDSGGDILTDYFSLKHDESKTYSGLPVGADYEISELPDDKGYNASVTVAKGKIEKNRNVTAAFENEKHKVIPTGSLIVRKTVAGPDAAMLPNTFDFSYSLIIPVDSAASEFDFVITDLYGNEVKRGKLAASGVFTLGHGQSITVSGLPVGTHYDISELASTTDYIVETSNSSGDVTQDENGAVINAYAVFVNTLRIGDLTVSKTAVGNQASPFDLFDFMITLYNDPEMIDVAEEVTGQFGDVFFFESGVAYISLEDGSSATAVGLPAGLYYKVEEINNNGYISSIASDQGGLYGNMMLGMFMLNSDIPSSVVASGMIAEGSTASAAFVNTKQLNIKKGDITISKVVTGDGDTEHQFGFTLNLFYHNTEGLPAAAATDVNLSGTITGGELSRTVEIEGGHAEFTLKHGERLDISGLPENIHYVVTEVDSFGHEVTISNTGAFSPASFYGSLGFGIMPLEDEPVAENNTAEGDVKGNEHVTVTFYNHREPEPEPEPVNTSFALTKNFTESGAAADGALTFEFNVELIGAIAPDGSLIEDAPTGGSAKVTVAKDAEFGTEIVRFNFQKAGTYTYQITETAYSGNIPKGSELEISKDIRTVTFEVYDNGGALAVVPIEPIVFTNKFTPPPMKMALLSLTKKVTDADKNEYTEGTFKFKVTLTDFTDYSENGFLNGEKTVVVTGGSTVEMTVPLGAAYEIAEIEIPDGYTDTTKLITGTANGETVEVTYNNIKDPEEEPEPEYAVIKLTKKVTDADENEYAEGTFKFKVTLTNFTDYSENGFLNGEKTVVVTGGSTVEMTVPLGAAYEIAEIEVPDGYTDTTKLITGTADGETVEVTYNNTKEPEEEPGPESEYGSLTLHKELLVNGVPTAGVRSFKFRIELIGSDFTADASGVVFENGVAVVTLRGGESITMTGLPAGVEYVITEESTYGYVLIYDSCVGLTGIITANSEANAIAVNAAIITPPNMPSWPTIPPYVPPTEPPIEILPSTEAGYSEGDDVEFADKNENPKTGRAFGVVSLLLAAVAAIFAKRK